MGFSRKTKYLFHILFRTSIAIPFTTLLLSSYGCTTVSLNRHIHEPENVRVDPESFNIDTVYKTVNDEFIVCSAWEEGFKVYSGRYTGPVTSGSEDKIQHHPVAVIKLKEVRDVKYCSEAVFSIFNSRQKNKWHIIKSISIDDASRMRHIESNPNLAPRDFMLEEGLYKYLTSNGLTLLYVNNRKIYDGYNYLYMDVPDMAKSKNLAESTKSFYYLLMPFTYAIDIVTFPIQWLMMCNAEC